MRDLPEAGVVLVVGYGNELRRDDGLGPWVARELAALGLPHVRVRALHQLVPELAAELTNARLVIFIDAHVEPCRERVTMEWLVPSGSPEVFAHGADPAAFLSLASIYGPVPSAVLVAVAGQDFRLGDGLSDFAAANARQALRLVRDLVHSGRWPTA
jgi:hydrogenase maturation protease